MYKKLLKIILLILLLSMRNVKANEYSEYMLKKYDKVPNVYVTKISSEHKIYDYMYIIARKSDNKFVYCIEPGIHIKDDIEYTGFNNGYDKSNLTKEQYEKIKLISYYGYGYIDTKKGINHADKKWYAVTQGLIWEIESNNHEIYFTDYLQGPKVNKYSLEYKEIKELVNNYDKLPSFSNQTENIYLGDKIILTDNNQTLDNFKVSTSNDNIKVSVYNNNIEIEALKNGTTTITLTKEFDFYKSKPIVYIAPSSQNLFKVGDLDPIITKINVNIKAGKLIINKVDSESNEANPQGDATLKDAIYGVFDEHDTLITKLSTNDEGYAQSENILNPNVNYYLKELTPSLGYKLDLNKYYFTIDSKSLTKNLTLKEDIIKRKVEIYKVYGSDETKILTPEPNIKFDIYLKNKNEYYKTIITDENGYANIILPYGTWIFKQQTTTENYAKVEDFEIIINNSNEEPITKTLIDMLITAKIKLIKIDSETNKIIQLSGIKFRIKDLTSNKYICQNVSYPNQEAICEYETNNGIMITPQPLIAGNYQIEEITTQLIEGYQINLEPLVFSINNNTILNNDKVIGPYLELKFANNPNRSEFELTKQDISTKTPIPNALIEIYNENNDLIHKEYTNKLGKIHLTNLPIGKYYFKEVKAPEGYILNDTVHYFEITKNGEIIKDIITNIKVPNTLKNDNCIYYICILTLGLKFLYKGLYE